MADRPEHFKAEYEGREVIIYYDPQDPSQIESQGGSSASRFSLLLGVVLTIYAGLALYRNRRTLFAKKTPAKKVPMKKGK